MIGIFTAIHKLIDSLLLLGVLLEETSSQMYVLSGIKDAISTLSKYKIIVIIMKPYLASKNPEGTAYTCLDVNTCNICGFRQWWSTNLITYFSIRII